jgi:Flp pilus assembly protein TadB
MSMKFTSNPDPFQNMRRQQEAMKKRLRDQQQRAMESMQQEQVRRRKAMQQDALRRSNESLQKQMAQQREHLRDMQQRQREMAYWAAQGPPPAAAPSCFLRLLRALFMLIVTVLALGVLFFVLLLFLNAVT